MTASYSGTPLPKKLGIKPGAVCAFVDAPADFAATLGALPADVEVRATLRGPLDVVVLFTKSRADLAKRFAAVAKNLAPAGGLWIAWPKKASGVATDLTEDVIRPIGLAAGLVDMESAFQNSKGSRRVQDRTSQGARRRPTCLAGWGR